MKRFLQLAFLTLCTQEAFATGVLNVLLAGGLLPLTASVSPTSLTYSYPSASLSTSSTTCSGAGGISPYTYGWSFGSGGVGITINSPSSATTSFSVSGAVVNTTYSGNAQCQVIDAGSRTSPYADVSVSLSRIPLLPPSLGDAALVVGTAVVGGSTYIGYWSPNSFGSLSPSTDYNGQIAEGIYWLQGTVSTRAMFLAVSQPSSNSSYITGMSVNGTSFATSSATYSYSGGVGTWEWASANNPFSGVGTSDPVYYY